MGTVVISVLRDGQEESAFTGRILPVGESARCDWCGSLTDTGGGCYTWHRYFDTMCEKCAATRRVTEPHVLGIDDV